MDLLLGLSSPQQTERKHRINAGGIVILRVINESYISLVSWAYRDINTDISADIFKLKEKEWPSISRAVNFLLDGPRAELHSCVVSSVPSWAY